jgi:cytochrome c biogenesis protein
LDSSIAPKSRTWNWLASLRTGIVLLILLVVAAALGTIILQRPLTDPETMASAYSPATLHWLDVLGLTDVFHAWWFAALLALLGINIVFASVERFPGAWRFFTRPYRRAESRFLAGLPLHKVISVRGGAEGLEAAERVFRRHGYKPQRVGEGAQASLYVERHRFSRLAPYVVHASLLLIFAGGILDAVRGYRGFVALGPHQQASDIELHTGVNKQLPFTVRCDAAGQVDYADGTPKRWWSKLTVLEHGRVVKQKEIAVNDPLVYRGIRFYQASYGSNGQLQEVRLTAVDRNDASNRKEIALSPQQSVQLDPQTSVQLAAFVPDFVLVGDEIESRSNEPNNPAIELRVNSKASGEATVWLFPRLPQFNHPSTSPYDFHYRDLSMGYFSGLQVSYEPGQWLVWAGAILMGMGLFMAFYFVHLRLWTVAVEDDRSRTALWLGASANKNREEVEQRFNKLAEEIEKDLAGEPSPVERRTAISLARV